MKAKRKYTRRIKPDMVEPYVVYVNFPSSLKEYAYLCNIPGIRQGDLMIANGTQVRVVRTASHDPIACRFIQPLPDYAEKAKAERRQEIVKRLRALQTEVAQLELWQKLARTNTEAKRLLAEYKRLGA